MCAADSPPSWIHAGEKGAVRNDLHNRKDVATILQPIEQAVLTRLGAVVGVDGGRACEHALDEIEKQIMGEKEMAPCVRQLRLADEDAHIRGCGDDASNFPS